MKALFLLTAGSFVLATACASVPKDAPEELHSADDAIKHANDIDADDTAPKTMKKAEHNLSNAVKLYDQSKDDKADGGDKLAQAKTEAVQAKKLADTAINLHTDVLAWDDGNLQAYQAMKEQGTALETAQADLAKMKAQQQPGAIVNPNFNQRQAVAFFNTDTAAVDDQMTIALDQLVKNLKDNNDLEVTLIGYADPRGNTDHNLSLSETRAKAIATYLEGQGIDAGRIKTEGRGETGSTAKGSDSLAQLQLDRRVDAEVQPLAH